MTVVTGDIRPYVGATVGAQWEVVLSPVGDHGRPVTVHTPDGRTIALPIEADVQSTTGEWSATLEPCDGAATPAGFRWRRQIRNTRTDVVVSDEILNVPTSVAPVPESPAILDDPPSAVESSALTGHKADNTAHGNPLGALATHAADTTAHGNPAAALAAHAAAVIDDGVHGVVDRVWEQHGTAGLTRRVMTQDAGNSFVSSVSGRWLTFTAQAAGGNQREAYLLPISSVNSELRSLLGPADTLALGVAQWWHLHRVTEVSPGVFRAWAVWTDTTIPIPTYLNLNVVEFSGAAGMLFNGGGVNSSLTTALNLIRYCPIVRARRSGGVVTVHTNVPWLPAVGDTGSLTGMAAAGFNVAGATVTATDQTRRTFTYAQAGGDATDADAGGTWEAATRTATIPYWLATRLIGNTLWAKQWRPEEAEPDWTDPSRVFSHTITTGSPAPHTTAGACAIGAAHMSSPNRLRFGGTTWRRIP